MANICLIFHATRNNVYGSSFHPNNFYLAVRITLATLDAMRFWVRRPLTSRRAFDPSAFLRTLWHAEQSSDRHEYKSKLVEVWFSVHRASLTSKGIP